MEDQTQLTTSLHLIFLRVEWNINNLNYLKSNSLVLSKLPEIYDIKPTTSNIIEWALSNAMGVMMDVAYLILEYDRLRNCPTAMQWKKYKGSEGEYMVSFTIDRISFKTLVARGMSVGDRFEICFAPKPPGSMTKKQRKADKGCHGVIVEDLEEHHGTHLALVRRRLIMQQPASLPRQHSADGLHHSSKSSALETAASMLIRDPPHNQRHR